MSPAHEDWTEMMGFNPRQLMSFSNKNIAQDFDMFVDLKVHRRKSVFVQSKNAVNYQRRK